MTQWGLDTLFNPSKRHMDEEKRRLQSTREEVGDSSGGKRIDLESGRVTIRKADKADDEDSAETTDGAAAEKKFARTKAEPKASAKKAAAKKAAEGKPAAEKPAEKKAEREMTPAAKRAAERRAKLRK